MFLKNDLSNYMTWQDRSDAKKWAWPGAIAEGWNVPGQTDAAQAIIGLDATEESREEARTMMAIGMEQLAKTLVVGDEDEIGYFVDEMADPCPEELDAPQVPVRVRLPKNVAEGEKLPVLFYTYGAGTMFTAATFDAETIEYQRQFGCAVVAPTYRPHPENKFPKNINDLHAAYLWMLENAEKYNFDTDRVVLAGESAGAWYSVALAHRLKRYNVTPAPRGVVAKNPIMDDRGIGISSTYTWPEGDGMTQMYCQQIFQSYVGFDNVGGRALSPEAFPNHATVDEVRGMPPMAIHVGESDPLRDGAIEYANKLLEAGVFCALHVWPGCAHGVVVGINFCSLSDPYQIRFRGEYYADIQGFFDYDFRRDIYGA